MRKRNHRPKSRRGKLLTSGPARSGAASAAVLLAPDDRALKEELAALRREQKELQQALFEAAQVQRKMCAPRELRRGSFEIAGEMFPVRHLSGDFLKILDLGPAVTLAIGDVTGKGLSAGLWVTYLVGLMRIYVSERADLAAAMAAINRDLCGLLAEPPMAALFLAQLDPYSGKLEYCNAGQPAALLLHGDATLEALQDGGPLLGALPDATFACGRAVLQPGDTLIAYSDGVVECRNTREEEFGAKRLSAAVSAAGSSSASQMLFSTLGAALDFAGGRPLEDDLTLLVTHRRAPRNP